MKASETSLRNLLEGGKQFQIPLFQRPYSWGEANWVTLWEDLMSLYREEVEGFYFLGPIVTQAIPGTADGISPFVVIDGQQRLTTLSLLLATLRSCLKQHDTKLADELYELYLINKFKKEDDHYKILPTQDDREIYKKIIQNKDKGIKEESRIYEAYKFFRKRLKEQNSNEDTVLDYARFKTVILERLMLVNITSDDKDNPYLIFESLNNKGQELTQADLVRNYIFMRLPREKQEKVYVDVWPPLQEQFKVKEKQNNHAEELNKALWYYLRKDGRKVNEKNVYQVLKKNFEKETDVLVELEKLSKFVNYYQRLTFPEKEPQPSLRLWFERLLRLDFTTSHIFLLNVYYEYEIGQLSLNDFEKILSYLESYFVRRLFTGISTRALGDTLSELLLKVRQQKSHNLVSGLHTVLINLQKNQIWPDDDSVRQGIITKPIYTNSSSDRVKLLLERIEAFFSKERVEPQNLTIEHIMPQTLTSKWRSTLGTGYNNVHKRWLHNLANLTLTGYNSELSNKAFDEKLGYLTSSNLSMNQYFRNVDCWNEEQIEGRANYLADIVLKVWPR